MLTSERRFGGSSKISSPETLHQTGRSQEELGLWWGEGEGVSCPEKKKKNFWSWSLLPAFYIWARSLPSRSETLFRSQLRPRVSGLLALNSSSKCYLMLKKFRPTLSFSSFYSLWGKCNGKLNLYSVLLQFLRSGESGAWQREVGPLLGPLPLRMIFLMPFIGPFPTPFHGGWWYRKPERRHMIQSKLVWQKCYQKVNIKNLRFFISFHTSSPSLNHSEFPLLDALLPCPHIPSSRPLRLHSW